MSIIFNKAGEKSKKKRKYNERISYSLNLKENLKAMGVRTLRMFRIIITWSSPKLNCCPNWRVIKEPNIVKIDYKLFLWNPQNQRSSHLQGAEWPCKVLANSSEIKLSLQLWLNHSSIIYPKVKKILSYFLVHSFLLVHHLILEE